MSYRIAKKMVQWFIRNDFLQQNDYEIYVYYIDSLLAKIFFYTAIIIAIMRLICKEKWFNYDNWMARYSISVEIK